MEGSEGAEEEEEVYLPSFPPAVGSVCPELCLKAAELVMAVRRLAASKDGTRRFLHLRHKPAAVRRPGQFRACCFDLANLDVPQFRGGSWRSSTSDSDFTGKPPKAEDPKRPGRLRSSLTHGGKLLKIRVWSWVQKQAGWSHIQVQQRGDGSTQLLFPGSPQNRGSRL